LGGTQEFASPEEALAHYGVKGMHWGERKEEETSGAPRRAQEETASSRSKSAEKTSFDTHAQQQLLVETAIGTPIGMGTGGKLEPSGTSGKPERSGMTRAQKNALIGLGVVAAAGAGYLAYSHYKNGTFFPGGKRPLEWDVSDLKHRSISDVDLVHGGFSKKYPSQKLSDLNFMNVDHSKGYANYTWKNVPEVGGMASNEFAKARHQDLIATLDEMREKYPAVRNLKIEVTPMSAVPGMEGMRAQGAIAAVMPLGKGEARVMYNDMMSSFGAGSRAATEAFVPGMFKDKYVGYHEMGHILAVAHGDMPPLGKMIDSSPENLENYGDLVKHLRKGVKYGAAGNVYHKDTFKRHGFSFKELSKLGGYAATDPRESMAELFGHYAHPDMRSRLTPDQLSRAEAMFNEMGGLT
jgi:hypothetical protein